VRPPLNGYIVSQTGAMSSPQRTVQDLFPPFAAEIESLCRREGRPDLADQIRVLPVVARCTCGEGNCAHFYTAPLPRGSYGPGHANLVLPADRGMVVLDIVAGRIAAVEVLDRPEVKRVLDEYLSPGPSSAG
jgi:hypothetical protein